MMGYYKMTAIKSILAATDFSVDARYAAERAAMIAAKLGITNGVILHALKSSWLDALKQFVNLPVETEQTVISDTSQLLNEIIIGIQHQTGFAFKPKLCSGNVLDTILKVSETFDLLVLGAREKIRSKILRLVRPLSDSFVRAGNRFWLSEENLKQSIDVCSSLSISLPIRCQHLHTAN